MTEVAKSQNNLQEFFKARGRFTLQWHLTAKCSNKCKHCYMFESDTYDSEIKNELSYEDCIKIIDDYLGTVGSWGCDLEINFTGGDPLLCPYLFDLIEYSNKNIEGVVIGILGNPDLLTKEKALKLRECGVSSYQISIDGLEKNHDFLRKKNSFKKAIEGLKIINESGMRSIVMMTISQLNAHEVIEVAKLAASQRADVFDFARVVPVGTGHQLSDNLIDPDDYRRLLLKLLEAYKQFKDINCLTQFGRKDHLWKLLYSELGLDYFPAGETCETIDGCSVGNNLLTLLADGTVLSCRRLPIVVGKMPEQGFEEILLRSPKLNTLRQIKSLKKCSQCDLLQYCRGCVGVAYGLTGNWTDPDPQCWKTV